MGDLPGHDFRGNQYVDGGGGGGSGGGGDSRTSGEKNIEIARMHERMAKSHADSANATSDVGMQMRHEAAMAVHQMAAVAARNGKYSPEHAATAEKLSDIARNRSLPVVKFSAATPAEFEAAKKAKDAADPFHAGNLAPKTPEDYKHLTPFLSPDHKTGFAITNDKDAVNIFNNGGAPGSGSAAVVEAIKSGARTLDCYSGFLPQLYSKAGFVETGRMKWNDDYAPPGWQATNKNARPDVVFMAYQGGDPKTLHERYGSFKYEQTKVIYDDWDKAKDDSRRAATR